MLISVVTATHNREKLLVNVAKSLELQTKKSFEWIIVNDGSIDNTQEVVEQLILECTFKVKYLHQENQGKGIAINNAMAIVEGDFVVLLDDDDSLSENAIQLIIENANKIYDNQSFAGIGFLKFNKTIDQHTSKDIYPLVQDSLMIFDKGIKGDKMEVFRTKVLQNFPFPKIENEKFIPEALVWNRIAAAGLTLLWINEAIYICEYQLEGISSNVDKVLIENFYGYSMYINELLKYKISKRTKMKQLLAYNRRAYIKRIPYKKICELIDINYSINYIWYYIAIMYVKLRE